MEKLEVDEVLVMRVRKFEWQVLRDLELVELEEVEVLELEKEYRVQSVVA